MDAKTNSRSQASGLSRLILQSALATALLLIGNVAVGQTTYTWNVAGSGSWTTAGNWTPSRTTPAANDILVVNNGGSKTISNVPTQTIGRLTIAGNTTVALSGPGGTQTLTIGNGTGDDLVVESGSSLTGNSNLENIVLSSSATADISGTFTINNVFSLSAANVVATISGTVVNAGTISGATAAKLSFGSGSIYQHSQNGGTVPTATWNSMSNCNITGMTSSYPSGMGQTFGNVTFSSTLSSNIEFSTNLTCNGNLTMNLAGNALRLTNGGTSRSISVGGDYTHNSGEFRLSNGTGTGTLNITGDFFHTGGNLVCVSDNGNTAINLTGNASITGGTLTLSEDNGDGTFNVGGDFTHTGGTIEETNSGVGIINFTGPGTQTYTSGGTTSGTINYTVNSGAFLQMAAAGTLVGNGSSGTFTLSSGATLGITSGNGITTSGTNGNIRVTGTRTFSTGANYVYNGTGAQNTGNGLPGTVNDLTVDNSGGTVTLDAMQAIVNDFSITTGSVAALGTFTHSANTLQLGGSFVAAGSWGHSSSPATNTNDVFFANNTGIVNVATMPCTDPDVPTVDASPMTICTGGTSTLSITSGNLNDATDWEWYTVSCGGTPAGTGASIMVSPGTTTTYFVRGEGGCVTPGACAMVTVTVVADPIAPVIAKDPADVEVCEGQTLTITVTTPGSGGTGTCNDEYRYSTDGGSTWTSWSTTIPSFAAITGTNLVNSRRICTELSCESSINQVSWTVVADPVAPVITKDPTDATVCEGQTLTVMVTAGSGGTGTCDDEYRQSTDGGSTWTSWSTTVPSFAAVTGTNLIESRRNCDGLGCESNVNQVSWTVVADPVAPVITKDPTDATVCEGQTLTVMVTAGSGGTGTCDDEYRQSTDGGSTWTSWSTTVPSFAAVTGTNLIESRRSCDGLDCDVSPSNQVSWTVNPNPTITSVNQPMVVCDAGPATIDVTGLPTSGNYDIEYGIGATTGLMANVSPNGSGEASFMTPALVLGDNGATLTVTKVTNTTTNCMLVPVGVSTTLSVVLSPDVLITADPSAATCVTGIAGIVLEVTGNMLGTSQNVTWSVAGGAATGTFTVNNSPALTTTFIVNPLFVADPSGTDVDVTVVYTRLDGCQDTEIITITIYPPVEANAYVNVGGMPTTGEVCTGGSIEVKVDPTFGFGQGDASQYSYQWALVTPTPPPPAAPIAGAVITDDDQQIATLQPAANAQQGQVYWIECTVTDLATCEAISNTVIITVVGPKEATISPAPGAPLYACSGDDIAGQFLIDVVDGMPNYTVTLRERNIGLLIDNNHTVTVNNLDQIVGGTVIFNNNTPNPIPLTYTIVSVFDADGCELVFPGGISGSVIVTWDPEPVKMTNVPNDPICSGDNAVIDVTTTVAGNTRFNWTASYGAVTGGANMATSVDFGVAAISDGPLTNATNATITVTYTITPYTYGQNGMDDGGAGDDCLGMPMDVMIDVEPAPMAEAVDNDSNSDANAETVCNGDAPVTTIDVTALDGNPYLISAVTIDPNITGVTRTAGDTDSDGSLLESGALTNANATSSETVVYEITPYTWGPNDTDDNGTGDDCLGTPFSVTITVEPTPAAVAVDDDGNGDPNTETVCNGSSPATTIDVTAINGNDFLISSITIDPNITGVLRSIGDTPADDDPLETGALTNSNATSSETVVYEITPYTWGPNGMDDNGTGDDCLGTPFSVTITVEPTPAAVAVDDDSNGDANTETVCNGDAPVTTIDVTALDGNDFLISNITIGPNITGVLRAIGDTPADDDPLETGALTNSNATSSETVVYEITPYTWGPNEIDDNGTGDDCLGTPFSVTITVEPTPAAVAIDDDSNGDANAETVCNGDAPVTTIDVTALDGNDYLISNITIGGSITGVTRTIGDTPADGSVLEPGALTNSNATSSETVVYEITPYTWGPNETDDNGTGDDCLGTPFSVTITVEPTPAAVAVDNDNNTLDNEETVSCGAAPVTTIDVTAIDGNDFLISNITIGPNITGVTRSIGDTPADGALVEPGNLTNANPSMVETVIYEITPYTWGPNETDDNGTGDDCLGTPFTVTISVEPTPIAVPSATSEIICSGEAPTITVDVTVLDGNDYLVDDVQVISGTITGFSAPDYTRMDGQTIDPNTLTNTGTTSGTVQYTIVPYTYGQNGMNDGGFGDDCQGVPFTVDVQVDPTPSMSAQSDALSTNVIIEDVLIDVGGLVPGWHICDGSAFSIPLTTDIDNIRLRWKVTAIGVNDNEITGYTVGDMGSHLFATAGSHTFTGTGVNLELVDAIRRNILFELTPEYDPDGIDNNGDECVGNTIQYRIRVWPTPEISLGGGGTVCNETPTTGLVTSSQTTGYSESGSADGNIAYDISIPATPGITELLAGLNLTDVDNGADDDDPSVDLSTLAGFPAQWTNTTNAAITFTIDVTPKFIPDDPNADPCSGMTQQISITVEPTPLAEAQDIDGDTDPLTETICHNGQIQTTIDVLAIDGHNYLVESISTSGPVGGVASAPYTRADGETIDPGMLTNTSSTVQTVTYTIRPYTDGPNLADDSGDPDDCLGTAFDVVITVEPEAAAQAVDNDSNTDPNTETICSGDTPVTTIDVTALDGNNFRIDEISNPDLVVGISTAPVVRGDGDLVEVNALTNTNSTPAVVTYTIVPYTYGPNGVDEDGLGDDCPGPSFEVDITVNPEPVGGNDTDETCSNVALNYDLQDNVNTLGNSVASDFSWTVVDNPDVTGEMNGSGDFITDNLVNVTNTDQVVVYTVTPTSEAPANCEGATFTVTVTVHPEPVGGNDTDMTCSDVALNYDLQNNVNTFGNGVASDFAWTVVDNPDVTGEMNGSGDFITDNLNNVSGVDQIVTYTVTPTSEADGCDGMTFEVEITVKSEPVGADPEPMTCSDVPLNIVLQSLITNGMAGVTFSWSAADNPNVTGETIGTSTAGTITDVLTNVSGGDQIVVYTVTPTGANGCEGDAFTVTVTVKAEPTVDPSPNSACIGVPTTIFGNPSPGSAPVVAYKWTLQSSSVVGPFSINGTPIFGAAGQMFLTENINITFPFGNPSAGLLAFTYQVEDANGCFSDIDVHTVTFVTQPNSGTANAPYNNPAHPGADFCSDFGAINLPSLLSGEDAGGVFMLVSGGGTVVGDTYNPVGIDGPGITQVVISYTVTAMAPCPGSATTLLYLNIQPTPDAGIPNPVANNDVCTDTDAFNLFDLIQNYDTGGTWSEITLSGGPLNPVTGIYDPSNVAGGSYQFSYTVFPMAPCANPDVVTVQVNVSEKATADAGPDQTICFSGTATLAGSFGGTAASATWSNYAPGTISDPNDPNAIFTPDASQYGTTVTLIWTTNDPDGVNFPCPPAVDEVDIIVEPIPMAEAQDDDGNGDPVAETVCNGAAPLTTIDVTVIDGNDYLISNITAGANISGVTRTAGDTPADGDQLEPGALTNANTTMSETVVYEITPYTYGPNGMNDDGLGDDCLGTPFTVTITVEPTPAAMAIDDDGNGNANTETICNGDVPLTTVDVTALDGNNYLISNVTAGPNISGGITAPGDTKADGAAIETGNLTNANLTMSETVIYEITPYTYGQNETDDNGMGDDCLGTPFTIVVTVEPTPAAMAIDDDGNGNANTETVCNGGAPLTTVDVTALDGNNYLISNVTAGPNISGGITAPGDTKADGDPIETGNLANANTTMAETVIYEITPYTYGQNETDDNGTGDDCLGTPFTIVVTVEPTPAAEPVDLDGNGDPNAETVCNGDMPVTRIDVTALDGNNYLVSNVITDPNISGGVTTTGDIKADADFIETGNLFNANPTMSETVTYEVTPYSYGQNEMDDSGMGDDCLGTPFTVVVTVEPTPAATGVDNDGNGNPNTEIVCNNLAPLTTVDVTALDGNNFLVSNVTAGPNISGGITAPGDIKADGDPIETGVLANASTSAAETVIYEITPYTYGPNGADDSATGDDCLGTPFTIVITVEPTPAAVAVDTDGNGDPNAETVCNGDGPITRINVLAVNGNDFLISNITIGPNISGVLRNIGDTPGDLSFLELGTLTNANPTDAETVVYEITPYTYGQNGINDNGTGDDCLGTPFEVTITVEPTPTAMAVAQPDEICHNENAVIDVTTDVNVPMSFFWTADGVAGSNTIGATSVALGAGAINDGPLVNNTTGDLVATYTITPYSYGANGVDDGGAGDDCLLSPPLTVQVTVKPEPTLTIVRNTNNICSGGDLDYTISTTITGGVLFDLTVEPLPNVDNPADLTDDNTLPITFTGLSAEPGNDYDFLHTIFNAAGLFDRGRVQVVATNIRLAENEDCTLANVTGASTRIYPEPRLVDPADKTICSGDDTDLDLDLQGLPSANPATAGYPVRIDWTVVTTTNDGGISGASNGSVEIYGAGGLETAINDIVQTLVNTGSLPETATYTITPRAAANTPAYNGDDCIGLPIEVVVEVLPEPLAVATPASQTVCSDEPIGVVFSTSNNIVGTTFAWSITSMLPPGVTASALSGNGDISTLTITNLTGAAVTVDFEVTPTGPAPSECPGDPITFSVTVDPEPVATATPLNQFNCSEDPFNVAFGTSNGIVGTTFAWSITSMLPPGVTASAMSGMGDINGLVITNESGGTVVVELEVVPTGPAPNFCVGDALPFTLTVYSPPTVAPGPNMMCIGDIQVISGNVTPGSGTVNSYKWTYLGGTATFFTINGVPVAPNAMFITENITIDASSVIATAGTIGLTYQVTDDNGCFSDAVSFVVTIKDLNNSGTALPPATICEDAGGYNLFQLLSGLGPNPGGTWAQTGGPNQGNLAGSTFFPSGVTGTMPVVFMFTYTADNGVCPPASTEVTLIVQPAPNAGEFDILADNDVCLGDPTFDLTTLLINADAGGTWTELTNSNAILNPGTGMLDLTNADAGSWTFRYEVPPTAPCSNSDFTDVILNIAPLPADNPILGDDMPCVNTTVMYSLTIPVNPGATYQWMLSGGGTITSGTTGNTVTIDWGSVAGTYTLTLVETDLSCSTTNTLEVELQEAAADFTFSVGSPDGLTIDFMDASTGGTVINWFWDFGDGNTSLDENPSHTYAMEGMYTVCLDIIADCGSDQVCMTVEVTSNVVCDTVTLYPGLNLISFDVQPGDPSLESIFADQILDGSLNAIFGRGPTGGIVIFDPLLIPFPGLNTLTEVEPGRGYYVRIYTSADTTDLIVCGDPIDPNLKVALNATWNIVGYIPQVSTTPEIYFEDLYGPPVPPVDILQIARGFTGGTSGTFQFFDPVLAPFPGLNTLTSIDNGFGYELRVNQAVSEGGWLIDPNGDEKVFQPFVSDQYTVVAATSNLSDKYVGELVSILTPNGKIVGEMEILPGGLLKTCPIYGDDTYSKQKGVAEGDWLYLEFNGEIIPLGLQYSSDRLIHFLDVTFEGENAVTGVNDLQQEAVLSVAPNPFTSTLLMGLDLPESAQVTIVIIDAFGRIVEVPQQLNRLQAGKYNFEWTPQGLPSGVYTLQLMIDQKLVSAQRLIYYQN